MPLQRAYTFSDFILPVLAMCAVVAASNILVQYPFDHFGLGEILTYGAFTYPIAFLVNDLANRTFGPAFARKVVYVGFAIAVVLSVWLATPRIAIASGTAFLTAQLLDITVFNRLRQLTWWKAPFASAIFGSLFRHIAVLLDRLCCQLCLDRRRDRPRQFVTCHAGALPLAGKSHCGCRWVLAI